jgi:uncharacterized protein YprB with RNaseH-like and TPR domain
VSIKKQKLAAKVLIFDIETSPLESFHWGLWDQNIALNQIKKDWHIMSWAAKWLDEKKVMYQDQRDVKDITNDKKTLEGIWKLLDEADVVITQNGKSFDVKKLNARFIMNGMQPPSSFKHIDTKRLATKHFGFTSNKLEYMAEKINKKFKKSSHKKFSGLSLWTECLKNNKAAWNEMKKYNIIDVLTTEELYHNLIPWDSTIDFSIYNPYKKIICSCGSTEFKENGHAYYASGVYKRYKCKSCGKEPKINRTKENRVR